MKKIPSFLALFIVISVLTFNCKSDKGKNEIDIESSISSSEDSKVAISNDKIIIETIDDGNRLTEKSLATYLPSKIGEFEPRGNPHHVTSEPRNANDGVNHRLTHVYEKDRDNLKLTIADYADDQRKINRFKEGGMQLGETDYGLSKSRTYKNDDGIFITESESFRDQGDGTKIIDSRRMTYRNARFLVEFEANALNGNNIPTLKEFNQYYNNSNLPKLFSVPIPQEEVIDVKIADNRKKLNGDELLPIPIVQEVCGNGELKLFVNDFEKEYNINRSYTYKSTDSRLIFIISQYGNPKTANKAVEQKIKDKNPKSEEVKNIGELASLSKIGNDLYFSVAYNEYLIELRAIKGMMAKDGVCCDCLSIEKLKKLAQGIIDKLP